MKTTAMEMAAMKAQAEAMKAAAAAMAARMVRRG